MIAAEIKARSGSVVAGVLDGDRFRLWTGRSGRRHVFSRLEGPIAADDLDGAVVLVATRAAARRVLWIGSAEEAASLPPRIGVEIFAHWLAETAAERAAIVADLVGAPDAGHSEHRPITVDLPRAA